ncbi:MAG: hypothetical protein LBG76_03815 [Treponema sp.]|jgi:cell division septum initiation protein DivIVA|nr:hypothetical protein [Treponema sp.]
MDEQDVLRHLLEVEASAAALVRDAQAEADRRLTENEKICRTAYEERYGQEAAALNARFEEQVARSRADYDAQLDTYRQRLNAIPVDTGSFCRLLDRFLGEVQ